MRLKTIGSVALLAVSSAALAQMTSPGGHHGNTTGNSSTHMNSTMPMNSSDETMANGMSSPDGTMTPNSF